MVSQPVHLAPPTREERRRLRQVVRDDAARRNLCPPLSMEDLGALADGLLEREGLDGTYRGWLMVEYHNCAWRDEMAAIPPDRRILLLPQCLRRQAVCQAQIDALGLLCAGCGNCTIPTLQDKADEMGTLSLVAEGFTSVVSLIRQGAADAVIGVSCLASLEKAFPLLVGHAVPGLAVPLNYDGCKDTEVDADYVETLLDLRSERIYNPLDYNKIKTAVEALFAPQALRGRFTFPDDVTARAALDWISEGGKRWRPYLLLAVYSALTGKTDYAGDPERAAVAVECFHKASLVHDDIQDADRLRYGKPTVHAVHGVPMAINVGDLLLGEGYRLLAACDDRRLLVETAAAHVALCKGQGMELDWSRHPAAFTMAFVLEIFRNKTVPAFEAALQLGLLCAGREDLREPVHAYAEALGIAFQLLDDAGDFEEEGPLLPRPSSVLAAVFEEVSDPGCRAELLSSADLRSTLEGERLDAALNRVRSLAGQYRQAALRALSPLQHVGLKSLLFRLTEKILG